MYNQILDNKGKTDSRTGSYICKFFQCLIGCLAINCHNMGLVVTLSDEGQGKRRLFVPPPVICLRSVSYYSVLGKCSSSCHWMIYLHLFTLRNFYAQMNQKYGWFNNLHENTENDLAISHQSDMEILNKPIVINQLIKQRKYTWESIDMWYDSLTRL